MKPLEIMRTLTKAAALALLGVLVIVGLYPWFIFVAASWLWALHFAHRLVPLWMQP